MCRERPTLGWLLRFGLLLCALCLCAHLYLQTRWQAGPAAPGPGLQARLHQNWAEAPAEVKETAMRGNDSGNLTQTRDALYRRSHRDRDQRSAACCPHQHAHRKAPRWHIDLQPWAGGSPSLEREARRFLHYITTPQVSCESLATGPSTSSKGGKAFEEGSSHQWAICLDTKFNLIQRTRSKRCRVYSFGLGVSDWSLERFLAGSGCEVHCFDPSLKQAHRYQAQMWLHRLSVDWRDPNPAAFAQRPHTSSKKLATIMNDFGHRELDVLKADMESAEWKILENLILDGVLDSVGQLLLEVHLHWPGFEVGGDNPSVVRFWFSLLKELEGSGFRLFHSHSDPSEPRLFLQRNLLDASSTYTLGWVNTRWRPSMST